jgi:hypothetical protein
MWCGKTTTLSFHFCMFFMSARFARFSFVLLTFFSLVPPLARISLQSALPLPMRSPTRPRSPRPHARLSRCRRLPLLRSLPPPLPLPLPPPLLLLLLPLPLLLLPWTHTLWCARVCSRCAPRVATARFSTLSGARAPSRRPCIIRPLVPPLPRHRSHRYRRRLCPRYALV